jgi:hypothetical protein
VDLVQLVQPTSRDVRAIEAKFFGKFIETWARLHASFLVHNEGRHHSTAGGVLLD